MFTNHQFIVGDARNKHLKDNSINLVITSPPYPMIKMWDEIFKSLNAKIDLNDYRQSFDLMHEELKKVYQRVFKALKEGGFLIINIGDATRSFNKKDFQLFANSARTIEICQKIGFVLLPRIYWNKRTNAPNKFLGSGCYPVHAYVTLETEHILIFRKGNKRLFSKEEEVIRKKSAFFHHERNLWFNDFWKDIVGSSQKIEQVERKRNGAFPFQLAYRLINMYSIEGDIVCDPFSGTGSTAIACAIAARSSIMIDVDQTFIKHSLMRLQKINIPKMNTYILNRAKHASDYIKKRKIKKKNNKDLSFYQNPFYGQVVSKQEENIELPFLENIELNNHFIKVFYKT